MSVGACADSDSSSTAAAEVAPGECANGQIGAAAEPPSNNVTALDRFAIEDRPVYQADRWSHHLLFAKVALWVRGGARRPCG